MLEKDVIQYELADNGVANPESLEFFRNLPQLTD